MPEQPADPIHYDMKIPPETDQSRQKDKSPKSPADDSERASDTDKETSVERGDDEPQNIRHER
jgi:hypothetical protein